LQREQTPILNSAPNPPSLAGAVSARGFSSAAGFRIAAVAPGHAELPLPRRPDLLQFFGHLHGDVITAPADQAAGIAVTSGVASGPGRGRRRNQGQLAQPRRRQRNRGPRQAPEMSGSIGVATVGIFVDDDTSEALCAFCTATMRALDLPAEFQ